MNDSVIYPKLTIVYQDEWLVVIDKPSGWLVHRTNIDRHEWRILVQALRDQLGRHVYPAHRLDKGTSGILVFALDSASCRALGAQFEAQAVSKTYWAVVRGWPTECGRIDHPLGHVADDYSDTGASWVERAAVTDFQRLATVELDVEVDRYPTSRYALLALFPQTGRQHQLRRHLKHAAHPIIGDATYGKGRHNRYFLSAFGADRMLLACVHMGLTHPVTGEWLSFQVPVSGVFASVLQQLNWPIDLAQTPLAGQPHELKSRLVD